MTGFAVYSTGADPRRLYADGTLSPATRARLEAVAGAGDRPPDLLVEPADGRVLWYFRADRRTAATRAGYFIAAYEAGDAPLLEGFAAALDRLDATEEWTLPTGEDPRWRVGRDLAGLDGGFPGLSAAQRARLARRLGADRTAERLDIGTGSYRAAGRIVAGVVGAGLDCVVAVGPATAAVPDGVDLLLRPGGYADGTPLSAAARACLAPDAPDGAPAEVPDDPPADRDAGVPYPTGGALAPADATAPLRAGLVVATGLGLYVAGLEVLRAGGAAPHLIAAGTGIGLAVAAGLLGLDRLARRRPGLAAVGLGLVVTASVVTGVRAVLHATGVMRGGSIATVVAAAHLAAVVGLGAYAAVVLWRRGTGAVFRGLRAAWTDR